MKILNIKNSLKILFCNITDTQKAAKIEEFKVEKIKINLNGNYIEINYRHCHFG